MAPTETTAHDTRASYLDETSQGADDIVSSIERRFGFRENRWGDQKLEAKDRYICPVCQCVRSEHGCTTSTGFEVSDSSYRGRESRVKLFIWCHHPDTFEAVAAARRFHEIEPVATE